MFINRMTVCFRNWGMIWPQATSYRNQLHNGTRPIPLDSNMLYFPPVFVMGGWLTNTFHRVERKPPTSLNSLVDLNCEVLPLGPPSPSALGSSPKPMYLAETTELPGVASNQRAHSYSQISQIYTSMFTHPSSATQMHTSRYLMILAHMHLHTLSRPERCGGFSK